MKIKKLVGLIATTVIVGGLFAGCGNNGQKATQGQAGGDGKKDTYVAVISKGYQHEFWKTVELGAKKAAGDAGIKYTFEGPDNETMVDAQVAMVENAITKKASAIMLAALDSKALVPVVEKAKDAGIPVVMFDSNVDSDIPVSFVATDNKAAGAIAAKEMAKIIGDKGKVAIVAHNEGTTTAIERRDGFKEEIEKNHPNIKIVAVQYSDGDHVKALGKANDIMTANPDLAGIYATNEGSAIGVATAVKEKGKAGKIAVVGFDSSDAEISLLNEGVINGFVVQSPFNMGVYGVQSCIDAINKKEVKKRIDTGATFISKENINTPESQKLLYPLGKK